MSGGACSCEKPGHRRHAAGERCGADTYGEGAKCYPCYAQDADEDRRTRERRSRDARHARQAEEAARV